MEQRHQGIEKGMGEKKVLYFELLGTFNYGMDKNMESGSELKIGKKTLAFLQYLIVNHDRHISSEELIETFWAQKGKAPENALRNMMYKVRNLLKKMFPKEDEILRTFPGGYVWSSDISLKLDTERFELCCMKAGKKSEAEALKLYREALSLYKGDFLPTNDSEWTTVSRQYYRTLYLEACKAVLPVLMEKEEWIEVVGICEQAYRIDFTIEDFTICQMQALIALGHAERALEIYEAYRNRLAEELELTPGNQLEYLHALVSGIGRRERDAEEILRLVCDATKEENQAFFCTFEVFRKIVVLEKRNVTRTDSTSALAIISLDKSDVVSTDAKRLERILLEGLRGGDPVARLEAGSYILLLPGACREDAYNVMGRIDASFHRIYHRSKARLTYSVAGLKAEEAEEA